MTTAERVVHLGRKNIGQPYKLFLLGEFPYELHDADPMYCLSASDCVTFVEHTYAAALAEDWASFFRTLQRIRYKDGTVGILTRNHYTEADWNVNNAWLFEDVTATLAGEAVRPLRVKVDRAAFFAKFGLGGDIAVEIFEDCYIPREELGSVLDRLRDADVVEIVKGSSQAPYVSHMGLITRDAAGGVMLLHSAKPAVREEPLESYVGKHPKILGVKILRIGDHD